MSYCELVLRDSQTSRLFHMRPMITRSTALLSMIFILLCSVTWAASSNFKSAHEELLSDSSFEFDFTEQPKPKPRTNSDNAFFKFLGELFEVLGPILKVLFYGLVIGIVAYIAYLIISEAIKLKRSHVPKVKTSAPVIPAYQPRAEDARIILDDVDALAAQGRYDEAVHTLLLRSIQDIRKKRPKSVPRALTSREISVLDILSLKAQQAFKQIGDRVEVSHFGGAPLDEEAFKQSRKAYEDFAFESRAAAAGPAS